MDVTNSSARHHAASVAEPGSNIRPPEEDQQSSRKRQKVSGSGTSRSTSVDDAGNDSLKHEAQTSDTVIEEMPTQATTPHTADQEMVDTEPTSSKVTLNLKSVQMVNAECSPPASPISPSRKFSPDSKGIRKAQLTSTRASHQTSIQTPSSSSSPSAQDSPIVESVIAIDDDQDDLDTNDLNDDIIIIGDDNEPVTAIELHNLNDFPFRDEKKPLQDDVRRIAHFLENDPINDGTVFSKLAQWIDDFLELTAGKPSYWTTLYRDHGGFWDALPELIVALNRRRTYFSDFMQRDGSGRTLLGSLFVNFARLTARFILVDFKAAKKAATTEERDAPFQASALYIGVLGGLVSESEHDTAQIGVNLQKHYNWDWDRVVAQMVSGMLSEGPVLDGLVALSEAELAVSTQTVQSLQRLFEASRVICRATTEFERLLARPQKAHSMQMEKLRCSLHPLYRYFKAMNDGLNTILDRNVTLLGPGAARVYVDCLSRILCLCMEHDPYPARDHLSQWQKEHRQIPLVYGPRVVSSEWRFRFLRKLLTSSQMQLRVVGATKMCSELFALFNEQRGGEPETVASKNPFLVYLAQLIIKMRIVDYLVGVGSHPEIIADSWPIVGFLIVTKTYTCQHSDMIWETVKGSQDPRIVEATLKLLSYYVNTLPYSDLLYLCEKLSELEIEAFTPAMRDYCSTILKYLRTSLKSEGDIPFIHAAPYIIFIQLIRKAAMDWHRNPSGSASIQTFAEQKLQELMRCGPSPAARRAIFASCIKDISERTNSAAGSISALMLILRQNLVEDLHDLCKDFPLTELIVRELESANSKQTMISVEGPVYDPASQARSDLLYNIIIHEPTNTTSELGRRLWEVLVGDNAKSSAYREAAWQMLNSASKKVGFNNTFLRDCFRDYLPELKREHLTLGALEFARDGVHDCTERHRSEHMEEIHGIDANGVEVIWRMMLIAPPGTIEQHATAILVALHVEEPLVASIPKEDAHHMRITLVERCLEQLSVAASSIRSSRTHGSSDEKEAMDITASMNDHSDEEIVFTRSLLLLREFLHCYRTYAEGKTVVVAASKGEPTMALQGETIGIRYQAYDGENTGSVETLEVGRDNSYDSFLSLIKKATGFDYFRVFHAGKELRPEEPLLQSSVSDLQLDRNLTLVRRSRAGESIGAAFLDIQSKVISRMEELWQYLSMDGNSAQEIYYFLIQLPVSQKLIAAFQADSTTREDVLPLQEPYKCLYANFALREFLTSKIKAGTLEQQTVIRCLNLMVGAFQSLDIVSSCTNELRAVVAQGLCESSSLLLKGCSDTDAVKGALTPLFCSKLALLLSYASTTRHSPRFLLIPNILEVLLLSAERSIEFWDAFKEQQNTLTILKSLLLDEPHATLRKSCTKLILDQCRSSPGTSVVSEIEFATYFWTALSTLIPLATSVGQSQAHEFFGLALHIFKIMADHSGSSLPLQSYCRSWGDALLCHDSREKMGHLDEMDVAAYGLASLLSCCLETAEESDQTLQTEDLAERLHTKHIFPDISEFDQISEKSPILNSATRKLICDTIISIIKNDSREYEDILDELHEVLPYNPRGDYPYEHEDMVYGFDREKTARSSAGYVGLKNLSNTCYLNSLLTQLFMNTSFRSFLMNANVAEGGSAQKLLSKTQILFCNMQNSVARFVDPSEFASSIKTYEDTKIDVSVQMDVDEFYNLLFDRWEGQILSSSDRRLFRSFYGGQLVQQVKSKECPHISERLEPFSAIQCDIKGKCTLQESLQAYVEGEVMEGDNKYKCSTCDHHVNAVKRACLKDIPDNLIFHLKRFDFNLRTMQRTKINDYFTFPHTIDMRPYTVAYLTNPEQDIREDMFELVGILIHSGTAESGHYYSYIRERPSSTGRWVEFNDDSVSTFDTAFIEGNCFGGPDVGGFEKGYSAYMLFYQRSSSVKAQQDALVAAKASSPLYVDMSDDYRSHIVVQNEALMRKYCLYDDTHSAFVLQLLANLDNINVDRCSATHELEKKALDVVNDHFDQIVSRKKDFPDLAAYYAAINNRIAKCAECACDFVSWHVEHIVGSRALIFKVPNADFRDKVRLLLFFALQKIKDDAPYAYSASKHNTDDASSSEESPELLPRLATLLCSHWSSIHLYTKTWQQYFFLLASLARSGPTEAATLLDLGFLRHILDLLRADPAVPNSAQYTRMLNILAKRQGSRYVSFEGPILFLEALLSACDLTLDCINDDEPFRIDFKGTDGRLPLTDHEYQLLTTVWNKGHVNIIVEKLLRHNQNESSTQNIVRMLIKGMPEITSPGIFHAISSGLGKQTPIGSVCPYLKGALIFCEEAQDDKEISTLVKLICNIVKASEDGEGGNYVDFFKDLFDLTPSHPEVNRVKWEAYIRRQASLWAPSLLTHYDSSVRAETEDHLISTLFKFDEPMLWARDSLEDADHTSRLDLRKAALTLGIKCVEFLDAQYVQRRRTTVTATMRSIHHIISQCKTIARDDDDPMANELSTQIQVVMPKLRELTVEEIEDEVSEWDNSDELSSSEFMDGNNEIGQGIIPV